jgi:hypothetical protein
LRKKTTKTATGHAFVKPAELAKYLLGWKFSNIVARFKSESSLRRPSRDGFDLVGTRHVLATSLDIAGGGDDAFVIKSDWSLGRLLESSNITCSDSNISTDSTTALEIGSETVGDIHHVRFSNITIKAAGDAGIGIVTMDGSNVHHISYRDITMSNVTSPFQFYIGTRLARPPSSCGAKRSTSGTAAGSISAGGKSRCRPGSIRDIVVERVVARDMYNRCHGGRNWTATVDGQDRDPAHGATAPQPVGPNLTFTNVTLTFRGGGAAADVARSPPHLWDGWMNIGTRPSWGWFLRNVVGLVLDGVRLDLDKSDGRPAIVLEAAENITFRGLRAARGALHHRQQQQRPPQQHHQRAVGYDIGIRGQCTGIDVVDSPGIVTRSIDQAVLK